MTASYYERPELWTAPPEPYQLQQRADVLALLPPDIGSILDVGCGNGFITNELPEEAEVVGIDTSREALRHVTRETRVASITEIPFDDDSFDLVLATDVLEHIPDASYARALSELLRVARRYVHVSVPFAEDVDAHRVRCPDCGAISHVNDHRRRYTERDLIGLFGDKARAVELRYSGDFTHMPHDPTTRLRERAARAANWRRRTTCPVCESPRAFVPAPGGRVARLLDLTRSLSWGGRFRADEIWAMRTEAMALYALAEAPVEPAAGPGSSASLLRIDFRNRLQQVVAGGFTAGHPWARFAVHGEHAFVDDGLRCVDGTASVTTRFPLVAEEGDRIRIRASAEGSVKELAVFAYDGWKTREELLVRLPLVGTDAVFELGVDVCWLPDAFGTALHLYTSEGVVLHELDWLPAGREAPSSPFVSVEPPHTVAAVRRNGVIVSWGAALDERGLLPCVELRPSRPLFDDEAEVEERGLDRRLLTVSARDRRRPASVRVEQQTAPSGPRSVLMLVHDQRIDRRVLDEARTLLGAGWDVTVAAGPADPTQRPTDEETYPDVPIVRAVPGFSPMLPHSTPEHLAIAGEIPWARFSPYHDEFLAEALARQPEVIVAHDLPQLGAAVLAAAETGARVVYDSHEVYPEQRHLFNQGLAWPLASLEAWLLPLVDETLTVNESIASFFETRYDVRRPDVILNAPQPPSNEPTDSAHFREGLRIPEEAQMLLYQGAYAPTRNLENLIAAFGEVQGEVVLVMLGPGFEDGSAPRRLAEELGLLGTRVFFHEPVGQKELLGYTAMADAGVIPYVPTDELAVYWCTPNKLFEFIVAGIPVLASDLPELRRFVSGQGIGLNRSFASSADIAAAVDEFFSTDLGTMRARARELSAAHAWPVQAARLKDVFERLADRPARAADPQARALAATRAATISAAFPRLLVHGDLAAAGTTTLGRELVRRSAGAATLRGRRYAGRLLRAAGLRQR